MYELQQMEARKWLTRVKLSHALGNAHRGHL